MLKPVILSICLFSFALFSCKKKDATASVQVNFIFKFDSTQERLNNIGVPAGVAVGNKAQSPVFNKMSAHYLELTPDQFTLLGSGDVLYKAPETDQGGTSAIDFSKSKFAGDGETFLSVALKDVKPGTYNWLRVSLAYQNYTIKLNAAGLSLYTTVASFIGFRTYVQNFKVKDSVVNVNGNRAQGFWAFEASTAGFGIVDSGQAPPGATTVPNPLFASSPIPPGSCVVTGQFAVPLVISGNETSNINVIISLSTNKSFEWKDMDGNNTYDPLNGDQVVDMGIRGLKPLIQ
ncbi:MAG: hypothetical protein ABI416_00630 [Ginsengibacter sp.]